MSEDNNENPINEQEEIIIQEEAPIEISASEENPDEPEKLELTKKQLKKLIFAAQGKRIIKDEDVPELSEEEIERLLKIAALKSMSFNYRPKKKFDKAYKKKRQAKNKATRKARKINAKNNR